MPRPIVALIAIVGSIVAASAIALADPTLGVPVTHTGNAGPPVEINECKLLYTGGLLVGSTAGVQVEFTNDTEKTADIIEFRVTSGAQGGIVRDVGTFSPGIEIKHHYRSGDGQMMFAPIFSHPHIQCAVETVHFKDGVVWRANQAAVAKSEDPPGDSAGDAPIAASPSKLAFTATGSAYDQFFTTTDPGDTGALSESDNCAQVASVTLVSQSATSAVFRVSPVGVGLCGATVKDGSGYTRLIPISVTSTAK